MATVSQVIYLSPRQMQMTCNHIHKKYYQQMSGTLERVHVAKLLIAQDMGKIHEVSSPGALEKVSFEDLLVEGDINESIEEDPEIAEPSLL